MDSKENEVQTKAVENDSVVEKKKIHPIILYIVAIILFTFVGSFVGGVLAAVEIGNKYGNEAVQKITQNDYIENKEYNAILMKNVTKANTVAQCVVFAIIVIILVAMNSKKIKEDMKKWNKKTALFVVLASIGTLAINMLLFNIFSHLGVNMSNQDKLDTMLNSIMIPTAIYIVILAPIVEEMVFRYSLGTLIKNKYVFVIVSSILFGIIHGVGISLIVYVAIGIALSLIYLKTNKNITASIATHMFNNVLGLISLLI